MLRIQILSIRANERYILRRAITAALHELSAEFSDLSSDIIEIDEAAEIIRQAQFLIQPTLVINEKIICSGRVPSKEEILLWIKQILPGKK